MKRVCTYACACVKERERGNEREQNQEASQKQAREARETDATSKRSTAKEASHPCAHFLPFHQFVSFLARLVSSAPPMQQLLHVRRYLAPPLSHARICVQCTMALSVVTGRALSRLLPPPQTCREKPQSVLFPSHRCSWPALIIHCCTRPFRGPHTIFTHHFVFFPAPIIHIMPSS